MNDIYKIIFKILFKMYEWLMISQKFCNTLIIFQWFMNWILCDYIRKIYYVYFNNIIIFSNTFEEYHWNVHLILQTLRKTELIISKTKFNLYINIIVFLKHIIFLKELKIAQNKVNKIMNWLTLRNSHEIKMFNELINYITKFILKLIEYSSILLYLTWKEIEFKWKIKQ